MVIYTQALKLINYIIMIVSNISPYIILALLYIAVIITLAAM